MPEFTPRANLYLPGGGLSGTIPDEEVDIDRINDNFRKIDTLLGALNVASTDRPSAPINGQLIYETDTRNILSYSAALLKWSPVGSVNAPSEAYRNEVFGATPATGSRCYRLDKLWLEEYFDDSKVTVAGWYPTSGRLPSIELRKNAVDTSFGGAAWTTIRDNWGFNPAVEVNAGTFLKYETGCIKTLLPGTYEFTYAIDANLATGGLILTVTASTAAHVQADNLVLIRGTFGRASGTVSGELTAVRTMAKDQFVQGNVNPEANAVAPGSRPQGNFVQARYVGPPYKV